MKSLIFSVFAGCAVGVSAFTATASVEPKEHKDSVVFLGGHPDDTEGFAATAFLLKDKYDIHVVDYTGGERGCGEVKYLNGWTKQTRLEEECAALAMLDTEPLYIGEVDAESGVSQRTITTIWRLLTELKPKAVFTHWPVDMHLDHRHCAVATMQAVQLLDCKPELYFFEVLTNQTCNWNALYSVDVTKTMAKKRELLRKYRCQNSADALVRHKTEQAAMRGQERLPQVDYAETFTTLDGKRIENGVLEQLTETAILNAPPSDQLRPRILEK